MRTNTMMRVVTLTTVAFGALMSSSLAYGQTASAVPASSDASDNGGDIIVTATRQSESITKVPISISAFSQETLDKRGVRDFGDIVRQTPGIVAETTHTTTNISIRGINSTVGAATTGIYIDDTPIQIRSLGYGGGNAYPVIFDLERVEVLRGPQGTLFGAGSEGGTVRFISPSPSLTKYSVYSRGELAFTEHGDASYETGLALGGPIVTDHLGVRISGYYRHDGGYIDRVRFEDKSPIQNDANYANTYVGRAAATWSPVPELKITPSVFYQNVYRNDGPDSWDNLQGDLSQPSQPFSDYPAGKFLNGNRVQEWVRDKFTLPALNVQYSFGKVDLIAIGSYFDRTQTFQSDYTTFDQSLFTGITLPIFPDQSANSYFVNGQKNYTGEVRLQSTDSNARLTWVVGGFYSRTKQLAIQQVEDKFFYQYAPFLIPFLPPLVDGRLIYDQKTNSIDTQIAGYGQINFKPVEPLTLTVGLRYGETRFDINSFAQGPVVGATVIDVGRQKEHPFTPKFGINYQATPTTLIYASASKGFRPGGYNPQVGACAADLSALGYDLPRRPGGRADGIPNGDRGSRYKDRGHRQRRIDPAAGGSVDENRRAARAHGLSGHLRYARPSPAGRKRRGRGVQDRTGLVRRRTAQGCEWLRQGRKAGRMGYGRAVASVVTGIHADHCRHAGLGLTRQSCHVVRHQRAQSLGQFQGTCRSRYREGHPQSRWRDHRT